MHFQNNTTWVIADMPCLWMDFFFFLATDYIRTFTWDKKLEMVVKSTGILGGQGKVIIKSFIFVLLFIQLEASNNCASKAATSSVQNCTFNYVEQGEE